MWVRDWNTGKLRWEGTPIDDKRSTKNKPKIIAKKILDKLKKNESAQQIIIDLNLIEIYGCEDKAKNKIMNVRYDYLRRRKK